MQLEIITPEKTLAKEDVDEVVASTATGQISIHPHHNNLVTLLTAGELLFKKSTKEKVFAITGGFIQVRDNTVTVLADYAARVEDIDIEHAVAAQKRAEEILKKGKAKLSEHEFEKAQADLRNSLMQIRIARRYKHRFNKG